MAIRKEIIVLSGGGHKGVVKISGVSGRDNYAKISCSLDFRPWGANLYVVGANIAKVPLDDVNQEVEVPFCANDSIGCVVRSSSLTMFGGRAAKSEMLAKIEQFNKEQGKRQSEKAQSPKGDSEAPIGSEIDREQSNIIDGGAECKVPIGSKSESGESIDKDEPISDCKNNDTADLQCESDDVKSAADFEIENNECDIPEPTIDVGKKNTYVGVAAQSDVNPLGEWTKYDGNNFYLAIKPQIDEMFICYPEEKLLGDTVPNSKWVRVDAEDGYYVVGLLYDEDTPAYICYGVPQFPTEDNTSRRAPAELENMCVWLPISEGAAIDGYWMIYQSARTGEIIK